MDNCLSVLYSSSKFLFISTKSAKYLFESLVSKREQVSFSQNRSRLLVQSLTKTAVTRFERQRLVFKLANYVLLALLFLQLTFWPLGFPLSLPSNSSRPVTSRFRHTVLLFCPVVRAIPLPSQSLTRLPYNYQTFNANPIDPLVSSPPPRHFSTPIPLLAAFIVIRPGLFPPWCFVSCCNYHPLKWIFLFRAARTNEDTLFARRIFFSKESIKALEMNFERKGIPNVATLAPRDTNYSINLNTCASIIIHRINCRQISLSFDVLLYILI